MNKQDTKKDPQLFNEYTLSLQTQCQVPFVLSIPPEISSMATIVKENNGKLPEYISEEMFDNLVAKLKQELVMSGILLLTPINPCGVLGTGCSCGYNSLSYDGGKSCRDTCQALATYKKALETRKQLLGEDY